MQCGVCLSVCPTYALTGLEVQSPRGRVMLYRAAMEGLTSDDAPVLQAAYDCLDCRACQTVCPSGVKPGELAIEARVGLQGGRAHQPVIKAMLFVFEHPWMLDAANWFVRAYQGLGLQAWMRRGKVLEKFGRFGRQLAGIEALIPARRVHAALRRTVAVETPALGESRGRVAFFLGCVMNAVLSDASAATVKVLTRNGFTVVTPHDTTCCGAPHIEEGELEGYRRVARRNVALFAGLDVDAIVTDCAACGAELKKYGKTLANEPVYAERAQAFSDKVYGLSEFLRHHGLRDLPSELGAERAGVTYQDACHLCHGQGVCDQPRDLLRVNPLLEYRELEQASDCCGSAGVYNVTHPEASQAILDKKVERVRKTGATILAAENPGCLLQLEAGMRQHGLEVEVAHTSVLLERAYLAADAARAGGELS